MAIIRARRNRAKFLPGELFAEPGWDILLELYAAELGQRRMSITSLGHEADVPPTTRLRWLRFLEEHRLVLRSNDPMDARRVFVRLSPGAVANLDALFAATPATEQLL